MSAGDRFVRRQNAARGSTSNTTAADITNDTAEINDGGYTYSSPEVTVPETGKYLYIGDIGRVVFASTRAVGTLVPYVNTATVWDGYRATHRYLRNSGGNHGASIGAAILDLTASDDVKIRNPGQMASPVTDAILNYATLASYGGALQLLHLGDGSLTEVRRTTDQAISTYTDANATRPWIDSTGTWTKLTGTTEVVDDDGLYPGSGGDFTLAANKKYLVVYGATIWSSDASRHTDILRLNIDGVNRQYVSGYQRNAASQGPPIIGMYLHETGGSTETLYLEATIESEGADAGTPQAGAMYVQIYTLDDNAEWIHVDNGTTDSLTTALAGTTTFYDTPLSSTFRADGNSDLSLDSGNDAVQNDSGSTKPVLAIGWTNWDRDSGASGTRKMPWGVFDNGGTDVGYGIGGAYSRGQQSGDDTFHASYVSAVLIDLANGADLSYRHLEPASGSNADMGVYASANRHFLGVQVLDLSTLVGAADATAVLTELVVSSTFDAVTVENQVNATAVAPDEAFTATFDQATPSAGSVATAPDFPITSTFDATITANNINATVDQSGNALVSSATFDAVTATGTTSDTATLTTLVVSSTFDAVTTQGEVNASATLTTLPIIGTFPAVTIIGEFSATAVLTELIVPATFDAVAADGGVLVGESWGLIPI